MTLAPSDSYLDVSFKARNILAPYKLMSLPIGHIYSPTIEVPKITYQLPHNIASDALRVY